ncbi:MAG: trigger factor [Oscillospiraceae bacterium]|nr:trigger factor [Oscillospiraceae bacterium]
MEFTYRGLTATLERHIVTASEIDHQLERLRQQTPRIAVVTDRPTQTGDEVVLDYAGFCKGEQFPGGTAQNQTLVLGSNTFIPGFEDQLLDKVPGEQVVVKVMFPTNYHAENLAGMAAEFHCTIHQIRVKSQYELDDTFAKEVGGCETLEEMRRKLGESLQAYTDERGEMDLQDRLLRQAAETLEIQITEDQINAAVEQQMQNLQAQLAQQGLSLEMYCSFMNTTEEALRADARGEATVGIRVQAAIERIVELEKLEATQEEIAQALGLICRQNKMTMEQLQPYYDAEFEAAVIRSVLASKVMKLIRDAAQVEES